MPKAEVVKCDMGPQFTVRWQNGYHSIASGGKLCFSETVVSSRSGALVKVFQPG